ncbi:hypothetical protein A5893_14000 [Pedobacter psychrophilus]|uniref:Uncharacterized protein n=1 Tax=Pedobacter psychrophilus TaxID=1826909 RepID=A0A179DCM8_9SPHI|nr:hypothetical protein [Pedobacter psychrophilus]OAQ38532.1 hypothetical protein A5893_14000 [Pedobacter psychrophilus]
MEVHQHSHQPHGKKTWRNYFWEFLMLFLAVFCGFLAEYQLEHTIEHDREQQYISSMIADMREDSAKINSSIDLCEKQIAGFDNLLENIYNRPYTDSSLKVMYITQLKYTHNRYSVFFTKRTIKQLENSGALRLIRNKSVSDSITFYNEECVMAETQADYFEKVRMNKVYDYSLKLFDNQYVLDYKGQVLKTLFDNGSKITLLDDDPRLIKEYANAITYARGSLKTYIFILKAIKAKIPTKLSFLEDNNH